jgi:hypothetical protein
MKNFFTALIGVVGLIIGSCTNESTVSSGSGTGVGNGIILGRVMYADGTPVRSAFVRLRPQGFLADTSGIPSTIQNDSIKTVVTDSDGFFRIHSVDKTTMYYIEVNDDRTAAEGTLYRIDSFVADTLRLPDRMATPMTTIKGSIRLSGLPSNAYIQIYGLDKIGKTDSLGRFEITELPAGDCEEGECEYGLRITIPLASGGFAIKSAELELSNAVNGVVTVELEYEDH